MSDHRVIFILAMFAIVAEVHSKDISVRQEVRQLLAEFELLKTQHLTDIATLKQEIAELKSKPYGAANLETSRHNEDVIRRWCQTSVKELHAEMKELSEAVNSSELLEQLHIIRNELKQALSDTSDLAQLTKAQEARIGKLESEIGRAKYETQSLRSSVAEVRGLVHKVNKELKNEFDLLADFNNVAVEEEAVTVHMRHSNQKMRHSKMIHNQISRLAAVQEQLDSYQQNIQTQMLDVQRRIDRITEPNWELVSAKVEFLELEAKVLRERLNNATQELSDLNKVHASILELREDMESIENKADATIPEFRKEISKLDVGFAKLHAQASYLKEDQENLRQSVKAIAVSISNAIDRAELDRLSVSHLNETINDLMSTSKQHFYRLNDHILKSEQQSDDNNNTHIVTLPELMGEVKELQPVEREYVDLVNQLPRDCSSVVGEPGTYLIHPGHGPVETYCNNGTTVLQRRYNGSVEFNRNFREYVKGFGDPAGEYWLGLQTMHQLTADNCSSMRIDITDIYGGFWYANYDIFTVGHADTGYVLTVGGFQGNASDAFEYQNHMEFSAMDRDRDISNIHCAGNYEGGWWYSHCQHVNINGKYALGLTWFDSVRNEWIAVATSEMRLRRRPCCP